MTLDLRRFAAPGGEIVLLATVQGLVSEELRVREAFETVSPVAVALGVSPESVAAMLRYQKVEDEDPIEELPDHDFVYAAKLGEYGPVALPPPDLAEALRLAAARGLPAYGVDLTEERYEDVFTKQVSAFALLRYGHVQRRLAKKPPQAPDARAFSLAWDAGVRRVKGIARVESLREVTIAAGAKTLATQVGGVILLVVDAPRESGVAAALA